MSPDDQNAEGERWVQEINRDGYRVPLDSEDIHEARLNGSVEEALALVKPFPPERMRIEQTGYDKRDRLENGKG